MLPLRSPLVLLCLAGVLLLLSSPLRDGGSAGSDSSGLLGCAAATKVADSCCDRETIDIGNDEIMHDRLQKLRVSRKPQQMPALRESTSVPFHRVVTC
jgi:hypothetical protein